MILTNLSAIIDLDGKIYHQVPIFRGVPQIFLRHSIAASVASLLVFGLLGLGTFSTFIENFPNFPSAWISWVFLSVYGSATIFTRVFSLPIPARLKSAATLMFAGNSLTASLALPS